MTDEPEEELPDDFDPIAYYAAHPNGGKTDLEEIFAAPVVADGVIGDTLLLPTKKTE